MLARSESKGDFFTRSFAEQDSRTPSFAGPYGSRRWTRLHSIPSLTNQESGARNGAIKQRKPKTNSVDKRLMLCVFPMFGNFISGSGPSIGKSDGLLKR
jgi:hypothetical protein